MRRMSLFSHMLIVPLVIATPSVWALTSTNTGSQHQSHQDGGRDQACETPLFGNLGTLTFPVSTSSPLAQAYVNQGMTWTFAFNHAEAVRAFQVAQRLDPTCAMCFWGEALALGPNINKPMSAADGQQAAAAVQTAQSLVSFATEKEKDLIAALAMRYAPGDDDRSELDANYAAAMRTLWYRHPADAHIGTLYAEALMDLSPWNYWDTDGRPGAHTKEMISVLESVLKFSPDHPGANHYLIHVLESVHPRAALAAADRLRDLVPGAGHLQHMPGHIYFRLGRYKDTITANIKGIAADKAYLASCHAPGFYPMMYVPHNFDFLIAAASLAGRSSLALKTAAELRDYSVPLLEHAPHMYDLQHINAALLLAQVRYAKWRDVLAAPEPPAELLLSRALRHYARSVAFSHTNQFEQSSDELKALKELADRPELSVATLMGVNTVAHLLRIAVLEADSLLASARNDLETAQALLVQAVTEQDSLSYMEPPPWHRSERVLLGKTLLEAKKYREAEEVFLADLKRLPENGYGLYGLYRSLKMQNRNKEATQVYDRYLGAFQDADRPAW